MDTPRLPITYSLLNLLFVLTKINVSTPFRENSMLRLPAPLHYADKLVKSLNRNWPVRENLLDAGCLYFL